MPSPEQTVRTAMRALNEEGVEGLLAYVHRDFVGVVPPEMSAEADVYRGPDGVRRYFALFDEHVSGLRFDPEELRAVGPFVATRLRVSGTGRFSGAPADMVVGSLAEVRDGRIVRLEAFPDESGALAEARRRSGALP